MGYLLALSGRGIKKTLTPKVGGGSGWGTGVTYGFCFRLWYSYYKDNALKMLSI